MFIIKFIIPVLVLSLMACSGSDQEKAKRFTEKGKQHLATQELAAAKIEFTNAIRLDDTSIDAHYEMALIMEAEKNWPQLESHLKRVLSLDPNHLLARIRLANFYMGSGKSGEAATHVNFLYAEAPENPDIALLKVAYLFKTKKMDDARTLLDKIFQLHPNHVDAVFLKADDLINLNKLDTALAVVNTGLSGNSNNLALNMTKIRILQALGNWSEMILAYEHLMQLYPANAAPVIALANGYAAHGEFDKAIVLLEQFATKNNRADVYLSAIDITLFANGINAAREKTQGYAKLNPNMPELHFALADIYTKENKVDLARQQIASVLDSGDDAAKREALSRLARMDLAQGNLDKAMQEVNKVLEKDPSNSSATATKANILLRQNKTDESIRILRTALRESPNAPDLLMTLGKTHEQQQQWELADEHYLRAIAAANNNILLKLHYAQFLVSRNKLKQADELLSPLVQNGIKNEQVLSLYIRIMLAQENWVTAEQTLKSLESLSGNKVEIAQLNGLLLIGQNKLDEAIPALKQYYSLAPDSSQAITLITQTYIKANKKDLAYQFLADALKANPKLYFAHLLQGDLYKEDSNYSAAEASYRNAIALSSKQFEAHNQLISLLIERQNYALAEKALNEAIAQSPKNIALQLTQANLYQQLKQPEKSIAIYQKLLKDNPGLDPIANNLAILLQSLGGSENLAQAAVIAERFKDSKTPQYLDTIGWIYYQMGKFNDALQPLQKAAKGLPQIGEVEYHLGATLLALGQKEQAGESLRKALANAKDETWVEDAKTLLAKATP